MRVRILKGAQDELRDASAYYNRLRNGLGKELRAEVRAGIRKIRENPESWPIREFHLRYFQTHRFPYGIIYEIRKSEILVAAIAHLHRRPDYWMNRVEKESD